MVEDYRRLSPEETRRLFRGFQIIETRRVEPSFSEEILTERRVTHIYDLTPPGASADQQVRILVNQRSGEPPVDVFQDAKSGKLTVNGMVTTLGAKTPEGLEVEVVTDVSPIHIVGARVTSFDDLKGLKGETVYVSGMEVIKRAEGLATQAHMKQLGIAELPLKFSRMNLEKPKNPSEN